MGINLVEAQRVITVLDEGISSLQSIAYLTDEVFDESVDFADYNPELATLIKEQAALCEEFVKQSKLGEFTEIESAGHRLRQNCRSLLRIMRNDPDVLEALKVLEGDRSYPVVHFGSLVESLKEQTITRLSMNATEEKNQKYYMADIRNREKKASNEVETLERELKIAKRERMKQRNTRQDHIIRLETELKDVRSLTQNEQEKIKNNLETQGVSMDESHKDSKAELLKEVKTLEEKLSNLRKENRELEETMRRKRNKVETEVELWIQKYDADMTERTDEYEKIKGAYDEELKSLEEYSKHIELIRKEREDEEERRRAAEEKRAREEAEKARLDDAATSIQAHWKGFLQRRLFEAEKKKKSKGKKGKKGKKKK